MSYRGRRLRPRDPKTGRLYRVIGPVPKLASPPEALRNAKLDNLTLVPASLLPFKDEWQEVANGLPEGVVLILLPPANSRPRKILDRVATILKADGHRVTVLPAQRFV